MEKEIQGFVLEVHGSAATPGFVAPLSFENPSPGAGPCSSSCCREAELQLKPLPAKTMCQPPPVLPHHV